MTEERDPLLQSLFAESVPAVGATEFTEGVMTKTYALRQKLIAAGLIAGVLLILYVWVFGAPLQDVVLSLTQVLSMNIIDIGENWLALILSPLNSVAGLLALAVKGVLTVQKKLRLLSL